MLVSGQTAEGFERGGAQSGIEAPFFDGGLEYPDPMVQRLIEISSERAKALKLLTEANQRLLALMDEGSRLRLKMIEQGYDMGEVEKILHPRPMIAGDEAA